jgi:hypothetical protein
MSTAREKNATVRDLAAKLSSTEMDLRTGSVALREGAIESLANISQDSNMSMRKGEP